MRLQLEGQLDGDPTRHLYHLNHSGHGLGRAGVERFYRCAEQRRMLQHGHQHAQECDADTDKPPLKE
jgi:hypothetical protein